MSLDLTGEAAAVAERLGIKADATVDQAEQTLMQHYCRVNAGSPENPISQSRVAAATRDLVERNIVESWVTRASQTLK